ncbi:BON domain-containing protein [Methylobacter sp.]|uniref:BON domain-containing protein n=1 Tax=Methylobacter sp. TaxID=2051955 RepID=UPI001204DF3F|nr:BON domain-containing protein [Methylobacter sp.]TAK64862.1 MAG: BON domain-containing protein [Methylobacter sp.]
MITRLLSIFALIAAGLLMMTGTVQAEQNSPRYLAAGTGSASESTERNVRDKSKTTLTPEDQKESESDINITANIRKAITDQESLSVNAHNVKIIARNGVVTLRGPVDSANESTEIQRIAKQTPGVKQVDNQLEIKAP